MTSSSRSETGPRRPHQRRSAHPLLVGAARRVNGHRTPFVEVHLSDVTQREAWRRFSVFEGNRKAVFFGKGVDSYLEGLAFLAALG